ncbi:amino acid transporter [Cryphonectria parasitica EP155]|uniref:Amino acid transporter n=1 Tax=Cryphonectria parasitica (strain ATCC 38755 / EP155) TaxID=660469 RepID=A0A9P4Y3K2_CRYP1|nr:amino acid transporter [Cryphonectria parasitica EP155]KAF3765732.1 amino acid transporter [Cryphonectria parasitica EP155]
MSEIELQHPVASTVAVDDKEYSKDDKDLIALGKKPRNFGFTSILGFSCTVLITWEGILIGGPAGVIWGYLIVWIGTLSVFAVLSELASMAPTAGGQYHWVAMLAPDSSRRFLSYITGWITFIGWQAVTASAAYLIGTLLEGVIIMCNPGYVPKPYQAMLFCWVILSFAVFINTVATKTLAHFEGLILVLHILGFFAILIPLVILGPHGDAFIFTTFVNLGAWPTDGLSFMVGLPASVSALIGADSAVHMSEEIRNASRVVPRAINTSVLVNGILGFAMLLAYLLLHVGTGSTAGAAIMGMIVVVLSVCSTVGVLASSSRMVWSFSRDRGLDKRTSIPIYTVAFTTIVSVLLSLITLGSSVAFNNIVNLSVVGLYSSYLLSCGLLLFRRLQKDGRIPGVLGVLNNIFACVYLAVLWFWAFWPPVTPVTPATMNFSLLTFGGTVLFAVLWYAVKGRKEYQGPIVEVKL